MGKKDKIFFKTSFFYIQAGLELVLLVNQNSQYIFTWTS